MAVTFDQARLIVRRAESPKWPPNHGHFMVARYGYQDTTHWCVVTGAREWLEQGNLDYMELDAPVLLVDKVTGELTRTTYLDPGVTAKLDAMDPVGRVPVEASAADE